MVYGRIHNLYRSRSRQFFKWKYSLLTSVLSRPALNALKAHTFELKVSWDCLILKALAQRNTLRLMWVPNHGGCESNETADDILENGVQCRFIGPESFCGLTKSHIIAHFQDWAIDQRISHWSNFPKQRR